MRFLFVGLYRPISYAKLSFHILVIHYQMSFEWHSGRVSETYIIGALLSTMCDK